MAARKKKAESESEPETTEGEAVSSEVSAESDVRRQSADTIVSKYTGWAAGMGAIPFPLWDAFAVGATQTVMVKELFELYEQPFSEAKARSAISVMIGSLSPVLLAGATASTLLKIVPGVGHVLAAASMPMLTSASTFAIGKVMTSHLEGGGSLTDFDSSSMKAKFTEAFEEGRRKFKDVTTPESAPESA